ncbi:MAG TPA: hypothetical protein VEG31_02790 [Thermoproteota archaeon]|nr:hypothetical protein [Thermoproteota archaeon]
MIVKISGVKEKEFTNELEEFLKRKTKANVSRKGGSLELPQDVKRSKVLDAVRWFVSKKAMKQEVRLIKTGSDIEIKKVEG